VTDLAARVRRRMASEPVALDDAVRAASGGIVDDAVLAGLRRSVEAEMVGAGPLEPLLALPGATDVLVNAPDSVWVDCGRGLERAVAEFADDDAVRRLAQRLAVAAGRRLDDAAPFVDAVLPDGTRLHAVLPPIASRTTLSLRVLARQPFDLLELRARGAMPGEVADVIQAAVSARLALLVTGGTGSGKTTLLGALLGLVPSDERIVLIEDAAEMVADHTHVVRLATRVANIEGGGAVGLPDLVRQALRMRPDRIVVGEFRGAEFADLVIALNTGHEGGAATMHANSAADVPARCLALGALAGLDGEAVATLVSAGFDLVVHLRRVGHARVVSELAVVTCEGNRLAVRPVWSAVTGRADGARELAMRLSSRGVAPPELLR
jgi:pilus assembly protein CpaF